MESLALDDGAIGGSTTNATDALTLDEAFDW